MTKKFYFLLKLFFLLSLFFPEVTFALVLQVPFGNVTQVDDLVDYIRQIYQYFLGIAGILTVVMFMFGGIRWMTAMGNSEKISKAKDTLMSALIGFVLTFISWIFLNTLNPQITELKAPNVPKIGGPASETLLGKDCSEWRKCTEFPNSPCANVRCGIACQDIDEETGEEIACQGAACNGDGECVEFVTPVPEFQRECQHICYSSTLTFDCSGIGSCYDYNEPAGEENPCTFIQGYDCRTICYSNPCFVDFDRGGCEVTRDQEGLVSCEPYR